MVSYTKNPYMEPGELQYKIFKADPRLVRSMLEAHGMLAD